MTDKSRKCEISEPVEDRDWPPGWYSCSPLHTGLCGLLCSGVKLVGVTPINNGHPAHAFKIKCLVNSIQQLSALVDMFVFEAYPHCSKLHSFWKKIKFTWENVVFPLLELSNIFVNMKLVHITLIYLLQNSFARAWAWTSLTSHLILRLIKGPYLLYFKE